MMNFSQALEAVKQGYRISRQNWNGKGMYVFLVQGSTFKVSRPPLIDFFPEDTEINYRPHLDMKYPDGTVGVWLAANSDILENDWIVYETEKSS